MKYKKPAKPATIKPIELRITGSGVRWTTMFKGSSGAAVTTYLKASPFITAIEVREPGKANTYTTVFQSKDHVPFKAQCRMINEYRT